MTELIQRVTTSIALGAIGVCTIYVPYIFIPIWIAMSAWIMIVEWPRLAPWYTGIIYPGALLLYVWHLYTYPMYRPIVWLGIISAMLYDTAAFSIGRRLGYHRMAPRISPRKTWEGTLGASCVLYLTYLTYVWWPHDMTSLPTIIHPAPAAIAVSAAAVCGDVCISWLKRRRGIKDCSNLLPGHGGLLDRCDSILMCIPILYLLYHADIIRLSA